MGFAQWIWQINETSKNLDEQVENLECSQWSVLKKSASCGN